MIRSYNLKEYLREYDIEKLDSFHVKYEKLFNVVYSIYSNSFEQLEELGYKGDADLLSVFDDYDNYQACINRIGSTLNDFKNKINDILDAYIDDVTEYIGVNYAIDTSNRYVVNKRTLKMIRTKLVDFLHYNDIVSHILTTKYDDPKNKNLSLAEIGKNEVVGRLKLSLAINTNNYTILNDYRKYDECVRVIFNFDNYNRLKNVYSTFSHVLSVFERGELFLPDYLVDTIDIEDYLSNRELFSEEEVEEASAGIIFKSRKVKYLTVRDDDSVTLVFINKESLDEFMVFLGYNIREDSDYPYYLGNEDLSSFTDSSEYEETDM